MAIDRVRSRQCLKAFDFRKLFIEELGWDKLSTKLVKQIDGVECRFQTVAEKRGVVVLVSDTIPEYAIRVKVDKLIAKDYFEHLIVFADKEHGKQVWQWVRNERGKPTAIRSHHYSTTQSGELLFQKLDSLVFTLEDEELLTLTSVTGRLKAFDVEKVTKKFYDRFKTEHACFLSFIKGIPDKDMAAWYASVMINRLMFLYFIQEKGFLNGDKDYLRNNLAESCNRKPDTYYRDFLCPLFFQGFARKKAERSAAINKLLGEIPYLNGGLFQKHEIEDHHEKTIVLSDKAFQKIFDFFKEYNWHLDERENRNDREINPDVLGYIFEKYINQKQMGAYYTKEDITEYIAQNTIIPFLLDEARKGCAVAFAADGSVWHLLQDDPDRYIYDAMKKGADLPLPTDISAGVSDVTRRGGWNRKAPEEFALPTEIWRETIDRLQRYRAIKTKLAAGEVHQLNDLITLNLNIRRFAEDVILDCEGPELLRTLWNAIGKVTVLDPTCGSGAFLFAALNILKPLYAACLSQMRTFVKDLEATGPHHPKKFEDFKKTLAESERHPKQDYFILKAIIVNNLFGVDIMEEAVEICKLRLFLKLVSQVDSQDRIEPLPDIDFNIRAGNTLVGYARYADVEKAVKSKLDFGDAMSRIEDKAKMLDSAVELFRRQQTQLDGTVTVEDKAELSRRFAELEAELNDYLSGEYGIKKNGIKDWKKSHKPFHWFCDFHRIIASGGFDVIIGNPPYVEFAKIRTEYAIKNYATLDCGNLFAFVLERCKQLVRSDGREGVIVPLSIVCTERMKSLRRTMDTSTIWTPSFDMRPSSLFEGVAQRLSIILQHNNNASSERISGGYRRWASAEREVLLNTNHFVKLGKKETAEVIPKIVSPLEASILDKLGSRQLEWFVHEDAAPIYVHRIVRYFIKALDKVPVFIDANRVAGRSDDYKPFSFDPTLRAYIVPLLNSSLFYWYWRSHSDGFHCGYGDVYRMPFKEAFSPAASENLENLGRALQQDLIKNSAEKKIRTKAGQITYQEFYPKKSKGLLDEIDSVLAKHYGLANDELDFIINYDIKYRLGADADEADEA